MTFLSRGRSIVAQWPELLVCRHSSTEAGPSRLWPRVSGSRAPLLATARTLQGRGWFNNALSPRFIHQRRTLHTSDILSNAARNSSTRALPTKDNPQTPVTVTNEAKIPTTTSVNPDAPTAPVSEKSQALTDWRIILKLAENIWPRDSPKTKIRVLAAMALLVGGKVLNVQVPFFFKDIVDSLNVPITSGTSVWILAGASIAGCKSNEGSLSSEGEEVK